MKIQTRGKGVRISDALLSHVERRVYFALGRFIDRIEKVEVLLTDINGPRGGLDKVCRITVKLKGLPKIRNEQRYTEIIDAINLTTDRIAFTVARRLDKAVTLIQRTKQNEIQEQEQGEEDGSDESEYKFERINLDT